MGKWGVKLSGLGIQLQDCSLPLQVGTLALVAQ